jgi:ATP-dependent RNA helicase DDX49/DBP8
VIAPIGQGGMAITMMTQYDVTRVKNIESDIKIQMTKYDIDEKEALKNLTSVAIAKKEIQLTLGESEFGKKRKINLLKRNSHQVSCSCSPASMIN